jgi:hypothetical protein
MWLFITGSGEVTQADLNSLVAFCGTKYASRFMPFLSVNTVLRDVHLVLFSPDNEDVAADAATNLAGSVSSAPMPAQVSIGISWSLAVSYRGGHARTYLPGVPASVMDALNTINNTTASGIASAAAGFHTDLEGFTASSIPSVEHGIVSFVRAKEWRTPPVFYRIVGAHVDARLDTQRRRLGRDLP